MERRDDLYLKLGIKQWSQYWDGGNNKYPPVTVDNIGALSTEQKLTLLLAILDERATICGFLRTPFQYGPGAMEALEALTGSSNAAIFIPSGGKDAKWLWRQKEGKHEWWWSRMAQLPRPVPVFIMVSSEEFETYVGGYHREVPIYIIGYDGFGIGCGRTASVQLITRNRFCGLITDDRTGGVTSEGQRVETREQFDTMIALSTGKKFCSVGPKYRCNILTIVRGDNLGIGTKNGVMCFPPLLLTSKEDMCLARLMELTFSYDFVEKQNLYSILVHTDTDNPRYENKLHKYEGRKLHTLRECCQSAFFRDAGGSVLSAEFWRNRYNFLNMWDVLKMQESAMFQLLESIEPAPVTKNGAVSELLKQLWDRHFWANPR